MIAKFLESSRIFVVLCCLSYDTLVAAERTKWCLNESCLEPLFESTVIRDYFTSDQNSLNMAVGMKLKITSFMYSDRVDLMGAIASDGRGGTIYKNFIDRRPFLEFLKLAIESNRIFYIVDVDARNRKAVKVENYTPLIKLYQNQLEEMKEEEKIFAARSVEKKSIEPVKNEPAAITPSPQTIAQSKVDETAPISVTEATTATIAAGAKSSSDESMPPTNVNVKTISAVPTEAPANGNLPELKNSKIPTASPDTIVSAVPIETANPKSTVSAAPIETTTPKSIVSVAPIETVTPESIVSAVPIETANPKSTVSAAPIETATPKSIVPAAPIDATNQEFVISPADTIITEKDQTITESPSSKNEQVSPEIAVRHNDNKPKIDPVIVRRAVKSAVASQPHVTTESPKNQPQKKDDLNLVKPSPTQAVNDEINEKVTATTLMENIQPKVVQSHQELIGEGINTTPSTTISPEIEVATVPSIIKSEYQTVEEVITATPLPEIYVSIPTTVSQEVESIPTTAAPILANIPSTVATKQDIIPEDPLSVSNAIDQSSKIEPKHDENKENINVEAPPAGAFAKNLANAINNINKKHENIEEESNSVADIVNTENPQTDRLPADGIKSADDGSKYCHKETCNSISEAMLADSLKSLDALHNSTLRPFLNTYVDELRVLLPYPFSTFDTTGIIVFTFLIVVFTVRLICVALSGSGPQQDVVDKRLLHDCMTRLKEQEVELTKSRVHATNSHQLADAKALIQKLHAANGELATKNASLDKKVQKQADLIAEYDDKIKQNARHVQDLENALHSKEREIENLKENISGLSSRNDALSGELSTALGQAESLRNEKESLEFEFQMTSEKLGDATTKLLLKETELAASKKSSNDLQKQVDQCMIIIDELQQKTISAASSSKKAKRGTNADAKSADSSDSSGNVIVKKAANVLVAAENDGDAVNEQDENGAGSGGSTAWSDFSEMDETDGANKGVEDHPSRKLSTESVTRQTKSTARAELFEIAELKSRIRVLESERDALRTTIAVEQKEKEGLSERLEQLKSDLADKRREAEQRETERFALQSQCQKLLHMVEERDNKAHGKEEQLKQLHERISQSERELRKVEDDKREVMSRVRELENSLRKSEDTNTKLTNKIYHEDRRLNEKINHLETQLSKFHSLSPNASGLSDLNLSGNSSDRDFVRQMPGMPVGDIPSLWSDIGSDVQYDSLNDLDRYRPNVSNMSNNVGSSRHRSSRKSLQMTVPLNNADMSGGELSSRASPFELEQIWMNRNNSVKEKRNSAGYRTRSRSAGRQSVSSGRQSARLVGMVPSPSSNLNLLR